MAYGITQMTELSTEQENFLLHHRIPKSAVFDAVGLGPKSYAPIMDSLEKWIAIGVTPCKRSNHTMRNRSGSCIQCSPATIEFRRRYVDEGEVYIAGTVLGRVIKVGMSLNPVDRMASLNNEGYGGISDWELLYRAKVSNAGMVEFSSQKELRNFAHPTTYLRAGKKVNCLETFSCSLSLGVAAIRKSADSELEEWMISSNSHEFETRTGGRFVRDPGISEAGRATPLVISKHKTSGTRLRPPTLNANFQEQDETSEITKSKTNANKRIAATDIIPEPVHDEERPLRHVKPSKKEQVRLKRHSAAKQDRLEDKASEKFRIGLEKTIDETLGSLTPFEEYLIREKFGISHKKPSQKSSRYSMSEMSDGLSWAPQYVRDMEAWAIQKLVRAAKLKKLKPFLGIIRKKSLSADLKAERAFCSALINSIN
jgi:hypothetical protein